MTTICATCKRNEVTCDGCDFDNCMQDNVQFICEFNHEHDKCNHNDCCAFGYKIVNLEWRFEMREATLYVCEYCGHESTNQRSIESCEKEHLRHPTITELIHRSNHIAPVAIYIAFEDDKCRRYVLAD